MAQAARQLKIETSEVEIASSYLKDAPPQEVISWALSYFADRIAIATGFGVEGVALIDMAARVQPGFKAFFIDTGFLFPETYALRERIEQHYGIRIERFSPRLTAEAQEQEYGPELWSRRPDSCCQIRKVEPLGEALRGLEAWATAIRRDQTAARATAREVEWDAHHQLVKVNPLVRWTRREVLRYVVKNDVPYNPLHDRGYSSIGCTHCTRAIVKGEAERAGRWSGHAKTECGLHTGAKAN